MFISWDYLQKNRDDYLAAEPEERAWLLDLWRRTRERQLHLAAALRQRHSDLAADHAACAELWTRMLAWADEQAGQLNLFKGAA